jgi:peptidoglycan/LPS O-acetylase OafA/YrhL
VNVKTLPSKRVDAEPNLLVSDNERLEKLDALTSLRFFAAAMLVLGHADVHFWKMQWFPWINLKQGVAFFFVLSGFILYYNYPVLKSRVDVQKFLVARFARIWPALAATMLIVLATIDSTRTYIASGSHLFWITACEFFMVKSWIPRWKYYSGLNMPAWSISTELFFYLVFPLLVVNFRKTWFPKLLLCASITGAVIVFDYLIFPANPSAQVPQDRIFEHWSLYFFPVTRLFEFAMGMSAALFYLRLKEVRSLSKELVTCFQMIGLALVAFSLKFTLMPVSEFIQTIPPPLDFWVDGCGACFAFAFFIVTMAFSQGLVAKALSHKALVFLGEISYSLYLLHWTMERWLTVQIKMGKIPVHDATTGWVIGTTFVFSMIAAASLMYLLVEKPSRKFITGKFAEYIHRKESRDLQRFASVPESRLVREVSTAGAPNKGKKG